jgi:hypothetical protein
LGEGNRKINNKRKCKANINPKKKGSREKVDVGYALIRKLLSCKTIKIRSPLPKTVRYITPH